MSQAAMQRPDIGQQRSYQEAHPGTTTPGAAQSGTAPTGEGMTGSAEHFAKEKYKEAREAFSEYMPHGTKENMQAAVRDTRSYSSRHPYVLPLLVLMSLLLGFSIGSMAGSMSGTSYGSHSRGSPEYEAHEKLDRILHSLYGRQSYADRLGLGGLMGHGPTSKPYFGGEEGILDKLGLTSPSSGKLGYGRSGGGSRGGWFGGGSSEPSRTDEALSYMGDTFKGIKDRFSSTPQEHQGLSSYLQEHLPTGLGGKPEEYHRPQKSFLEKVKNLYSKSEWEKVDEAEQKLREVLHAAAQRGEL